MSLWFRAEARAEPQHNNNNTNNNKDFIDAIMIASSLFIKMPLPSTLQGWDKDVHCQCHSKEASMEVSLSLCEIISLVYLAIS